MFKKNKNILGQKIIFGKKHFWSKNVMGKKKSKYIWS